jgi:catechol 2,3-dioxygenase-like lactoylglutathione lyase family enzyme
VIAPCETREVAEQPHGVGVERLIPILFVRDIAAEKRFYTELGFSITYEGSEFPGFVALGSGLVEFGMEQRDDFDDANPPRTLLWQFGITDVDASRAVLDAMGLPYTEETMTPGEDWVYRVLRTTTPNGYVLLLEGPREA